MIPETTATTKTSTDKKLASNISCYLLGALPETSFPDLITVNFKNINFFSG